MGTSSWTTKNKWFYKQRWFRRLHPSPRLWQELKITSDSTGALRRQLIESRRHQATWQNVCQGLASLLNVLGRSNCSHVCQRFLGLSRNHLSASLLPLSRKLLFQTSRRYYILNIHTTVWNNKAVTQAVDCTSIPEPCKLCPGCLCGFLYWENTQLELQTGIQSVITYNSIQKVYFF